MPTIRDIAREADVSASTVSLVLNQSPVVSEQLRKRVLSVADRLEYRPGARGRPRGSRVPRTYRMAVVYTRRALIGDQLCLISDEWLRGIREQCMRHAIYLELIAGVEKSVNDRFFERTVESPDLHAVMLIGVSNEDGYLQRAIASGKSVVVMNRTPQHSEFSYVTMDNHGAGLKVMAHLKAQGHQRVFIVTGPSVESYPPARLAGAHAGIAAEGLTLAGEAVLDPDRAAPEAAEQVCQQISASAATAVYFLGDSIASRCLEIWERRGVRIPEDLSVVGFDNSAERLSDGRRLTSVAYDRPAMGRQLVDIALKIVRERGRLCNLSAVFATELNGGDTTAPPFELNHENAACAALAGDE